MKEGMMFFTDTYLTVGGLFIFFVFFLAVIVWSFLPSNRTRFHYFETLPFEKGDKHESRI